MHQVSGTHINLRNKEEERKIINTPIPHFADSNDHAATSSDNCYSSRSCDGSHGCGCGSCSCRRRWGSGHRCCGTAKCCCDSRCSSCCITSPLSVESGVGQPGWIYEQRQSSGQSTDRGQCALLHAVCGQSGAIRFGARAEGGVL